MAQDPWAEFEEVGTAPATVAPAAPRPVTIGTPKPEKPKEPPSGYTWGPGGTLQYIPGGPADPDKQTPGRSVKQIPNSAADRLEGQVTAVSNFERFANSFDPKYAGMGSSVENLAQAYSPIAVGTEGQRDWWADFKQADAVLRNQLFGASLTGNEKQSWKETTVSPDMTPDEVKRNIDRRLALAKQVLARRGRFMKANQYDPDAVSALMGEYDPDSTNDATPPPQEGFEGELAAALGDPDLSPQERLTAALDVSRRYHRRIGVKEAAEAAKTGKTTFVEDPSLGDQIVSSLKSDIAGLGQGLAALPDAAAKALGGVAAIPFELFGYPDPNSTAGQLLGRPGGAPGFLNPMQFGREIEKVAPTPQDWPGWLTRKGSEFLGAAAGFPTRAGNALTEFVAGKPPPPVPPMTRPRVSNEQFLEDTNALKIDPTVATTGAPAAQLATSAIGKTFGGAAPVVAGATRMVEQGRNALARMAGQEGRALHPERMGEKAKVGALKYRDASRNDVSKLYDEATQIAGDARVIPENAVKQLDEHIAYFDSVPGGTESAAYIKGLRDELVEKFPNGVTVAGIRGMRTELRNKFYKDNLRGTDVERRVMQVVDEIGADLAQSLNAAGKGQAATLFRQADQAWKIRADTLDEIIMPIIGKKGEKSGQQIAAALESASVGNGQKLDRFLRSLPPDAAGDARATLLTGLGKATSGNQGAEGSNFSFNTLLRQWNDLGPTARRALFNEGDREAMNRLARVAERVKGSEKYTNWSNTGSTGLNATHILWFWNEPVSASGALALTYGLGHVLASPGAARAILRITTAKTPTEARSAIKSLSAVAARNPAATNDILGLQNHLARALQSPTSAAAADEKENVR